MSFETLVETAIRRNSAFPAEMTDIVLCRSMGWSWAELMATPPEQVEYARVLLQKEALIAKERENARG